MKFGQMCRWCLANREPGGTVSVGVITPLLLSEINFPVCTIQCRLDESGLQTVSVKESGSLNIWLGKGLLRSDSKLVPVTTTIHSVLGLPVLWVLFC